MAEWEWGCHQETGRRTEGAEESCDGGRACLQGRNTRPASRHLPQITLRPAECFLRKEPLNFSPLRAGRHCPSFQVSTQRMEEGKGIVQGRQQVIGHSKVKSGSCPRAVPAGGHCSGPRTGGQSRHSAIGRLGGGSTRVGPVGWDTPFLVPPPGVCSCSHPSCPLGGAGGWTTFLRPCAPVSSPPTQSGTFTAVP